MRKTFKYRLLGNRQIFDKAEQWLNLCRRLYNVALEQRIMIHRQNYGSISCYSQINQLPELKRAFLEYKMVDSMVLQEVLERLDKAHLNFFRRVKTGKGKAGFPRFKGRDRYDSFTLKRTGWKLNGKYLFVTKIGRFKLRLSRPVLGDIKTVTIRKVASGKWYVCFSCDNVPERKLKESLLAIGLDVGIQSFCVDSEGHKIANPKYFRQSVSLLRRRQRVLFRRKKGSNGRHRARVLVAKTHDRIHNQRYDFLHKTANQYIGKYGSIYIEDLDIQGLLPHNLLNRYIFDASWGEFFRLLKYKAAEAGRLVVKIPASNTSQMCSGCGEKVEKSLAIRTHACPYCGLVIDRDENAAKNICRVGQTLQEVTYAVTQGVS